MQEKEELAILNAKKMVPGVSNASENPNARKKDFLGLQSRKGGH